MTRIGFDSSQVVLNREISMKFGRQVNVERIPIPQKTYDEQDIARIGDAFVEFYRSVYGEGAAFVEAGMEIMAIHVTASVPLARPSLIKRSLGSPKADHARKGSRDVYWGEKKAYQVTPIYDGDKLEPGNVIAGPALAELATTTIMVPHDSQLKIDEYGFFVM